jgi:hypothetical protein
MVCVVADRYIPLSSVLEGFVILKLNPDYQQDHLSSWVGELNSQFCLVFAYRWSLLSSTSNFSNFAVKLPFVLLQSALVMLRLWNCIAPILPCLLCMDALSLRRRKITAHSWKMIYYMSWQQLCSHWSRVERVAFKDVYPGSRNEVVANLQFIQRLHCICGIIWISYQTLFFILHLLSCTVTSTW